MANLDLKKKGCYEIFDKILDRFYGFGALICFRFFRQVEKQRQRYTACQHTDVYLSFCCAFFTLMPVITSVPFILNHPYKPMNLTPFIDVSAGRGDFLRQVAMNTIMTVPFGFLFPLTRNRTAEFGRTVFFCFLMSLGIEILQPFFNRSSDVTDLITNVIGGMAGYGFYVIFKPVTFWILDHLKTRR